MHRNRPSSDPLGDSHLDFGSSPWPAVGGAAPNADAEQGAGRNAGLLADHDDGHHRGETVADYLNTTFYLGLSVSSYIMTAVLLVVLTAQLMARRYIPVIYWVVVLITPLER